MDTTINFLIGRYTRCGAISLCSLFGVHIYARIGNAKEYFGFITSKNGKISFGG